MQNADQQPTLRGNHTTDALATIAATDLETAMGGLLPRGYDEALAAGEKEAQRPTRRRSHAH